MAVIHVFVPKADREHLDKLARKQGISAHQLVRNAAYAHLNMAYKPTVVIPNGAVKSQPVAPTPAVEPTVAELRQVERKRFTSADEDDSPIVAGKPITRKPRRT